MHGSMSIKSSLLTCTRTYSTWTSSHTIILQITKRFNTT